MSWDRTRNHVHNCETNARYKNIMPHTDHQSILTVTSPLPTKHTHAHKHTLTPAPINTFNYLQTHTHSYNKPPIHIRIYIQPYTHTHNHPLKCIHTQQHTHGHATFIHPPSYTHPWMDGWMDSKSENKRH